MSEACRNIASKEYNAINPADSESEEESGDIDNDYNIEFIDYNKKYKVYLTENDCEHAIKAEDINNYFLVEWYEDNISDFWVWEDILCAPALAWLSGDQGQDLLSAIESKIQNAINTAQTSIEVIIEPEDDLFFMEIDDEIYNSPPPKKVMELLRILKYKTSVTELEENKFIIKISWGQSVKN
jgi:hypothetical protein